MINAIEAHHAEETQTEKKKRGRPIAPWRHKEDGSCNKLPLDPKYQLKYWYEKYRTPYTCDICGNTLQSCSSAVHKHKRGIHCQLAKLKKELEAKTATEQTTGN